MKLHIVAYQRAEIKFHLSTSLPLFLHWFKLKMSATLTVHTISHIAPAFDKGDIKWTIKQLVDRLLMADNKWKVAKKVNQDSLQLLLSTQWLKQRMRSVR